MSKVRSKITEPQLNLRQTLEFTKAEFAVVAMREEAQNGLDYGAKHIKMYALEQDGAYYTYVHHDGTAFESTQDIKQALQAATSLGEAGVQGSGMKVSAIIQVEEPEDTELVVYSQCQDGAESAARARLDGNELIVSEVPSWVRTIKDVVGTKYKDEAKVAYIARFTNQHTRRKERSTSDDVRGISPITRERMMLLARLCPRVGNDAETIYGPSIVLGKGSKVRTIDSAIHGLRVDPDNEDGKGGHGGGDGAMRLYSPEVFAGVFASHVWDIPIHNVKVSTGGYTYVLDLNLKLEAYPGVMYTGNQAKVTRLFPLNQDYCEKVNRERDYGFSYGTARNAYTAIYPERRVFFSISAAAVEKRYQRLATDPVFCTSAEMLAELGIAPSMATKMYPLEEEYKAAIGATDPNSTGRKPAFISTFDVAKVQSVTRDSDGTSVKRSITAAVELTELFYSNNGSACRDMMLAAVRKLAKDNPLVLDEVREVHQKYFPGLEDEEWIEDLDVRTVRKRLWMTEVQDDGKELPITHIDPLSKAERFRKVKFYYDEALTLTVDQEIRLDSEGVKITLAEDGEYILNVDVPYTVGVNGQKERLFTAEKIMAAQDAGAVVLPYPTVHALVSGDTERYRLALKLQYPIPMKDEDTGEPQEKEPGRPQPPRRKTPTLPMDSEIPYGQVIGKKFYLNTNNVRVQALFRFNHERNPVAHNIAKEFYRKLDDQARWLVDAVKGLDLHFSRSINDDIREAYSGNPEQYHINLILGRMILGDEAEKVLNKIRDSGGLDEQVSPAIISDLNERSKGKVAA